MHCLLIWFVVFFKSCSVLRVLCSVFRPLTFVSCGCFWWLFSLRMYNSLVERCFVDCVDSFTRKSLQKQEETCVMRCAEKFLKHTMRVGMRFAELNQNAPTQDWKICFFSLVFGTVYESKTRINRLLVVQVTLILFFEHQLLYCEIIITKSNSDIEIICISMRVYEKLYHIEILVTNSNFSLYSFGFYTLDNI